jgi:DNA-binding transcriptional ArsR family regulator
VDPTYVLKALKHGADGVLVIGCRIGECHYITGNLQAREKIMLTQVMLERAGFSPQRIEMRFISSAEGTKYIESVKEFTEKIRSLGPSPIKSPEKRAEILRTLDSLIATASDYRIRAIIAKKLQMVDEGNVYNEKIAKEEMDKIIEEALKAEFVRNAIIASLKEDARSCTALAKVLEIPPDIVLRHLSYLRKKNVIDVDKVVEREPLYKVL